VKVIGNLTKDAIIRAVASEGLTVTQVIGTPVVFETATTNNVDIAYDSNAQKVVIVYKDVGNSNAGTAIVGTVSGNAISFGSPVIFEDAEASHIRITYDANAQKVVVVYQDGNNSDYGTARVGTVSGTSISFGTVVVFRSAATIPYDITYDSNAQKVVIAQRYSASPNAGYGTVGTVSGTSISFGSDTQFNAASTGRVRAVYDTNAQKVVFAYEDAGNSSRGTAVVGTVSGTSISFGSEVVFHSAQASEIGIAYDSSAQKVVIGFRDQNGSVNIGKAIVGTVSGTSISFGSATAFGNANDEYIAVVYDTDAQKIVVAYSDTSASGKLNVGTVSGTSISFGSEVQFESGRSDYVEAVYDPIQKRVVIAYKDVGNSSYGTAVVTKTGYSAASGGTIADGAPVIVNANGTVSSISQSAASVGTFNTYSATEISDSGSIPSVVYDTNSDRIVVFYGDDANSNYGTAVVGTVSSGSISFGTAVVFESSKTQFISAVFDSSNNKIIVAYTEYDDSRAGNCVVGTVDPSDNSISFGSEAEFAADARPKSIAFDSSNNKALIVYKDGSQMANARVGTVSGTSISFGSNNIWQTGQTNEPQVAFDSSNNKFVINYVDAHNSDKGAARVGTVSGTSISLGSEVIFHTGTCSSMASAFDSTNNKIITVFANNGDGRKGTAQVGTVSGTSISYGSAVVFNAASTDDIAIDFDSANGKVVIAFTDDGDSGKGKLIVGTVSGTSISFEDPITFRSQDGRFTSTGFDPDTGQTFVFYSKTVSGTERGEYVIANTVTKNLTSENFVGIMNGATLDGTNGEILSSCSIARNQTGLTSGQTYFVTPTGALSETAGNPSVTAGTAISSTELIVKG